jgi:MarR family transcriptional regulator, organic hydroperoxide resistance regulator
MPRKAAAAAEHRRRRFDSLAQETYLSLWRTYDRLKALEDDLFAAQGLSAQQYNTLRLLEAAHPEAMTVQQLGEKLISRAPDMTRLLDRLETGGWIARVRPPENRRIVQVTLTPQGSTLLKEFADKVRDCHERQLGHLTAAQQKQLIQLLAAARGPHEAEGSAWR